MSTKALNTPIQKTPAKTVEQLSIQEYTRPISSSNEILEYLLSWRPKVTWIVQQGQKCNESSEITLIKILDLFSKEITLLEEEVKQSILTGALKTDSSIQ